MSVTISINTQSEIHKNDIGTLFEIEILSNEVAVDISAATVKRLIFLKPNGTKNTVNCNFTTDGTDGLLQYLSVAGDLDQVGILGVQLYVEIGSQIWSSDFETIVVRENL